MKTPPLIPLLRLGFAILALTVATPIPAFAAKETPHLESYEPWDPEVVEIFRRIPVQDQGRIKPLDTLAQFRLYRYHGKRTMKFKVGTGDDVEKVAITPMEWFLDMLFRPEVAEKFPTFTVAEARIIRSIGLEPHGMTEVKETAGEERSYTFEKQRDMYSYAELLPARARLSELGQEYFNIEDDQRSYDQNLLLTLSGNVSDYEFLSNQLTFARDGIPVPVGELPGEVFGDTGERLEATEMISKMDDLRAFLNGDASRVTEGLERAMRIFQFYADSAVRFAIFPPKDAEEDAWLSTGQIMLASVDDAEIRPWGMERLTALEELVAAQDDPAAFKAKASEFADLVVKDADARGEYGSVGMEVGFYKANYFYRALVLFLLGFVLLAFSWLSPASKTSLRLTKGVSVLAVLGLISLVVGVVIRCIIQQRAPIYNLYDTILFITGVAVLIALFIEYINRERVGLAVAVILGAGGMFLAMRFEVKNADDTMESMRAVLASNFWLSTHVTTITLGYAGGLLAAGIAHVYILGKLFGVRKGDEKFYRSITRMTYGVTCFTLFFALVGTVLGGIWANYSWGRFWGWDPKENGALMIVLWSLAILHARLGGYIRDLGINQAAIVGAIIVSFSWWGVNQLGVGLHAYGFTDGIWGALFIFWAFELVVMGLGCIVWLMERGASPPKKKQPKVTPESGRDETAAATA